MTKRASMPGAMGAPWACLALYTGTGVRTCRPLPLDLEEHRRACWPEWSLVQCRLHEKVSSLSASHTRATCTENMCKARKGRESSRQGVRFTSWRSPKQTLTTRSINGAFGHPIRAPRAEVPLEMAPLHCGPLKSRSDVKQAVQVRGEDAGPASPAHMGDVGRPTPRGRKALGESFRGAPRCWVVGCAGSPLHREAFLWCSFLSLASGGHT